MGTLFDVTPILTSNNTPSPYVVTASSYYSSWMPYKCFDGSMSNVNDDGWCTNGTTSGWIMLDAGSEIQVSTIGLVGYRITVGCQAKVISIQYSNDGLNFVDIISNKTMTWSTDNLIEKIDLGKSYKFRYLKLIIHSNYGQSNTGMNEIKFYLDIDLLDKVSNTKAFHSTILPMNTTENILSKEKDFRVGRMGIANDDENFGDIYITGKDGKAHLAKAGIKSEVIFDGSMATVGDYKLSKTIDAFKILMIESKNNSISFNVLPPMTSNTTPSPLVATASNVYGGYNIWRAFNQTNSEITDCWLTANKTGWLKIDTGKNTQSNCVFLSPRNDGASVKIFSIEGSNDDAVWETLVTSTSVIPLSGNLYSFGKTVNYRYYRLNSTDLSTYNAVSRFDLRMSYDNLNEYDVVESSKNLVRLKFKDVVYIDSDKITVIESYSNICKIIGIY